MGDYRDLCRHCARARGDHRHTDQRCPGEGSLDWPPVGPVADAYWKERRTVFAQ